MLCVYLGGYFIPLIIQMFASNCSLVFYCNIVCLTTTTGLFINEIIQMKSSGLSNYFGDGWNINDMIIITLTYVYGTLRLFTERFRVNFLPIVDFEFIDGHLETEIALDML